MELNLKYYKGTDEYSDGDIENKIIDFIKKYPNDYEQAFEEDCSWPVFYHLSSIRKNVISWYPFKNDASILEVGAGMGAITEELVKKCKKVTSIELSKRRATAILERNKNAKNLEVFVGNFKDIELTEKYDYILLNGVFEYAGLYINSNSPYVDFLNKLKSYLKEDGKILIAIENRMGLKYWCGAGEDHVGIPYEGINGYLKTNFARTFSKEELNEMFSKCGMKANFYYMFPDYKFPQIIYTDSSLDKNIFLNYSPYYYRKMNLIINENRIFDLIYKNKMIPFFSNSYFLELSNVEENVKIEFVKFNNFYRNKYCDIYTYYKNDRFYKAANTIEAKSKLEEIVEINHNMDKLDINNVNVFKDGDNIYSLPISGVTLEKLLKDYYVFGDENRIFDIYDQIYELCKKACGDNISYNSKNIFDKYKLKIPKEELSKMHFYSKVLIDLIPSNLITFEDDINVFDQEWIEENAPIEYVMYRSIITVFLQFSDSNKIINKLFKKYNINSKIMSLLDNAFLNSLRNQHFDKYVCFSTNYNVIESNDIFNEFEQIITANENLINDHKLLKEEYHNIIKDNDCLKETNNDLLKDNNCLKETNNDLLKDNNCLKETNNDLLKEKDNLNEKLIQSKTINNSLVNENNLLFNQYNITLNELNRVINSKGYKCVLKLRNIYNKILSIFDYRLSDISRNNKKSILYVVQSWVDINNLNNTSIGGTTLHVLQIIKKLKKKYNVYVLTCIDSKFVLVYFDKDRQKIYDLGISSITMQYNKFDYKFYDLINTLIDDLKIDIMHINHIISFPCDLSFISKKIPTIVTLHDYTTICPRFFLLDKNSKLCNNPASSKCESCVNCENIKTRNDSINMLLNNASTVIVPDDSLKNKIEKYYNVYDIKVIPNGIDYECFTKFKYCDKKPGKIKNIALVGVIDEHKGSKLAKKIIENTKNKDIIYHLFGMSNTEEYLMHNHENYIYHGSYNQGDLPKLLNDNHIDLVLLLSKCPESFSYVLSETILSKVPVIGIDIGAIGSRIKKDSVGIVVDYNSTENDIINKYDDVFSIENYSRYISNMKNGPFTTDEMVKMIDRYYLNISGIKKKKLINIRRKLKKYVKKYDLKVGKK